MAQLVPYRNVPALVGYYVGVAALIPCLGLALAPVAIVLGIIGVLQATRRPEAKGKVHAWVAIALGAFSLVAHAGFALVVVLTMPR